MKISTYLQVLNNIIEKYISVGKRNHYGTDNWKNYT